MIIIDIFFLLLTSFFGIRSIDLFNKKFSFVPKKKFIYLFFFHTIMTVFRYIYFFPVSDSNAYYYSARWNLSLGTDIISSITFIFAKLLSLPPLSVFLIFHLFSFYAIVVFYISILENIIPSKKVLQILHISLYLPGLHFFTATIGKDGLMLLGICLVFYSLNHYNCRKKYLFLGLFITFLIRPHIFGILCISIVFAMILHRKFFRSKVVLIIFSLTTVFSFYFINLILNYTSTFKTTISMSNIFDLFMVFNKFTEYQKMNLQKIAALNTSFIATTEYSFFYKLFTFLFRPSVFDFLNSKSLLFLFSAIENVWYMILAVFMFHKRFFSFLWCKKNLFYTANFIFFALMVCIFSLQTHILGIAIRMKIMILPSMISIVLISQSYLSFIELRNTSKGEIN